LEDDFPLYFSGLPNQSLRMLCVDEFSELFHKLNAPPRAAMYILCPVARQTPRLATSERNWLLSLPLLMYLSSRCLFFCGERPEI
jgi:hypothetical protein